MWVQQVPQREERHRLALGKEPLSVCSQWFSCIPTAIHDLLHMDTTPEAQHHPASSAASNIADDSAQGRVCEFT